MEQIDRTVVTMKLDAEDYENIYLRIRGKLWKQAVAAVTLLGLAIGGVGWIYVERAAQKSIDAYVTTENFKAKVLLVALSRIDGLEQRTMALQGTLDAREKSIALKTNLPLISGPNGFSVLDPNGGRFSVEVGQIEGAGDVKFANPYDKPPLVFIVDTEDRFGRPMMYPSKFSRESAGVPKLADGVTTDGFIVQPRPGQMHVGKARWVAIGS